MQCWPLKPVAGYLTLPVKQVTSMLQHIGESDGISLANELLDVLSAKVRLDACTIIAYENGTRASPLSHAGRLHGGSFAETISKYVRHFVSHDEIQSVISSAKSGGRQDTWCQLVARDEISNEQYRTVCYDHTGISERLAILCHYEDQRWLSIKLYRGREHGKFQDQEIERIEACAPLVVQAVRLFYSNHLYRNQLRDVLLLRLQRLFPTLSKREQDLLRGVLDGRSSPDIASDMGIQQVSLQTYQKRLYRKLGISSQREIIPLCTLP